MSEHNILIAGGGIGGLTTALSLAARGMHVQVFEQAAAFAEVGAGIQLSPNCTRVLHQLGLREALEAYAYLPEATEIRVWNSGKRLARTILGQRALARYHYPYYHMHRADLMTVLIEAAQDNPRIRLHTGATVEGFIDHDSGVRVSTGEQTVDGTALIGADGIHSTVRKLLAGDDSPRFTGNVAWRLLVPTHALSPDMSVPNATVWWGPGKHFVHYNVRQGEWVNCVCVVEKSGWEVESWTEPGEHAELRADFAGWHPIVRALIEAADPTTCYKWALFDRPPLARWGLGRATLLGDACHPTLPFLAQGAAMAIEDGAVLAACLERADTNSIPAALRRYAELRAPRAARIQSRSRRNARVFHLTGISAWARNLVTPVLAERTLHEVYRYDATAAATGS
ncbi:MAG: monooxygenase [Gammaproteobacteria bacterium]|nr:monooxygenase [Gammaproteobacteria bacterium]